MSGFQLDTSGEVRQKSLAQQPDGSYRSHWQWPDLDAFTQGYIEALPWEELTEARIGKSLPLRRAAFRDLAPETLARIIEDCAAIVERTGWTRLDHVIGREAWRLRQSCTLFYGLMPLTVVLGDDGKVYLSVQS